MLLAWFSMILFSIAQPYTKDTSMSLQKSPYSLQESIQKLTMVLEKRKIQVFARIDHSYNAKEVKESLSGNYLLIFGNPLVGTKLMQQNPAIGLDLPLKILIFEDKGTVYFAYKNLSQLAQSYSLEKHPIVGKIHSLMGKLVAEAIGE